MFSLILITASRSVTSIVCLVYVVIYIVLFLYSELAHFQLLFIIAIELLIFCVDHRFFGLHGGRDGFHLFVVEYLDVLHEVPNSGVEDRSDQHKTYKNQGNVQINIIHIAFNVIHAIHNNIITLRRGTILTSRWHQNGTQP